MLLNKEQSPVVGGSESSGTQKSSASDEKIPMPDQDFSEANSQFELVEDNSDDSEKVPIVNPLSIHY